jgi:hypothetical protein
MRSILFIAVHSLSTYNHLSYLFVFNLGTALKQFTPDLEHILKTADITKSGRTALSAEGIYSVNDLISAEYRISNGNIKLRKGNRIDLVDIVYWIRAFKKKHARRPEVLTEFTEASFDQFQLSGDGISLVNNRMLQDLYTHAPQNSDTATEDMLNGRSSPINNVLSEGSSMEALSNRLRQGRETEEDKARIAQLLPGATKNR